MSLNTALPRMKNVLAFCIAAAIPAAYAATDGTGQTLTLTPAADETSITILWVPATDDFGPRPPCNQKPYTLTLYNDQTLVATFTEQTTPLLTDSSGFCYLQRTITSGALYNNKVSPGVWSATANNPVGTPITETRVIQACTPLQGKQPMYWTRNSGYTDNFYSVSASQRDISINQAGYRDRGVPFAMPSPTRFGTERFRRYFKSTPEVEHFYTADAQQGQSYTQAGYAYEGVEGYLFRAYKPGTVALHRYGQRYSSGDRESLYTINLNDAYAVGMRYYGIAGYVCPP